jgi:hypothetical protein
MPRARGQAKQPQCSSSRREVAPQMSRGLRLGSDNCCRRRRCRRPLRRRRGEGESLTQEQPRNRACASSKLVNAHASAFNNTHPCATDTLEGHPMKIRSLPRRKIYPCGTTAGRDPSDLHASSRRDRQIRLALSLMMLAGPGRKKQIWRGLAGRSTAACPLLSFEDRKRSEASARSPRLDPKQFGSPNTRRKKL